MFVQQAYLSIVERFQQGLWDTKKFTKTDVKQHFDDCRGLGVEFSSFYTLYCHVACELSAPPGNKLIKKRWNHIIMLAKESTVHVCLIVLYFFNHLLPLVCWNRNNGRLLLKQQSS